MYAPFCDHDQMRLRVRELAQARNVHMADLVRNGLTKSLMRWYWFNTNNGKSSKPLLRVMHLDRCDQVAQIIGVPTRELFVDVDVPVENAAFEPKDIVAEKSKQDN